MWLPSHALSLGGTRVDALVARDVAVGGAEGMNVSLPVQDDAAAIVRLASQASESARVRRTPCSPKRRATSGYRPDGHDELAQQIAHAAHNGT